MKIKQLKNPKCNNGIDDDEDGKIDYPEDEDEIQEDGSIIKMFRNFGNWAWLIVIIIIGATAYSFSFIAKRKKRKEQ